MGGSSKDMHASCDLCDEVLPQRYELQTSMKGNRAKEMRIYSDLHARNSVERSRMLGTLERGWV